ncbi:MAG TPA: hypothetical protein PLM83_08745, partial [Bacillota bacterium]|nr:hypothetical protein [Bacillota bacterium]
EVHWTTPYHGQSKPIERAWKTLCEEVSKHPKFAGALSDSVEAGVEVWAWRCDVGLDRISLDAEVPVNI